MMYPLAEYDGRMKTHGLEQAARRSRAPPAAKRRRNGCFRTSSSTSLPTVLADAPPLPGEEARYAQVRALS